MGHLLEVVEDQLERRQTLELGGQAGKYHVDDVRGTGRELVEELGGDRIEPIECVGNALRNMSGSSSPRSRLIQATGL